MLTTVAVDVSGSTRPSDNTLTVRRASKELKEALRQGVLADVVIRWPKFSHIDLHRNNVDECGAHMLRKALAWCEQTVVLDLHENWGCDAR